MGYGISTRVKILWHDPDKLEWIINETLKTELKACRIHDIKYSVIDGIHDHIAIIIYESMGE